LRTSSSWRSGLGAGREGVPRGHGADEPPRDGGGQQRISAGDGSDALQEDVGLGVLDEEAAGAETKGFVDVVVFVERREDHDPRPVQALLLQDPPGRLKTVHPRHPDVH
jgi:hypothetical protein